MGSFDKYINSLVVSNDDQIQEDVWVNCAVTEIFSDFE